MADSMSHTAAGAGRRPNGVLLLAHGGPDSLEDVEPFLVNIRGGRPFPPALLQEVRERYALIGGKSPLLDLSRMQAAALEKELNAAGGDGYRVYVGMRNWRPFIKDVMARIQSEGVERLVVLCLAPQNSRKSVGLYLQHVRQAQADLGWEIPTCFVETWHKEPLLIEAFAEKLRKARDQFPAAEPPSVVFTAHTLP